MTDPIARIAAPSALGRTGQLTIVVALLAVAGCGKPPVTAVPITAPWSKMKLPIDSKAIVWGSNASEIKILHQGRIEVVAEAYVNYFEQGNWTTTKRERSDVSYHYGFHKDGEQMDVEIYVFKDVGVIIQRVSQSPQITQPPRVVSAPPQPKPLGLGQQYLRDLKPTSVVSLPEGVDHKFDRQFAVHKVVFENGVYFCPPSANSTGTATFELGAGYSRLKGGTAISDHRFGQAHSPVTFRVLGDGKVLWNSKPLQMCGAWEAFDVDVTGVKQLTLEVSCPSSHTGAHGSWMDPVLVKATP